MSRALVVALLQVPVSLLGLVLLMNDSPAISGIADVLHGESGVTTSGSTARGIAETLPVVFFLVGNGVWLWLTARMWAGRDWARVTMTALSTLTVLALFAVLPGGDATTTVPAVLAAGLAVALVVFLYRPESGSWFSRR
ncbi:hypothetical protein [Actinomycetospora flava]|uniref:Uncharacterized protein n=1 Tax=Actinomycetospora flava TaxID=3129232 RepID=A0ABU8M0N7_9PSEU